MQEARPHSLRPTLLHTCNGIVCRVDAVTGIIDTVAGNHSLFNPQLLMYQYSGDGGPAANATLNRAMGMAFDAAGNLFIADSGNKVIRKVIW